MKKLKAWQIVLLVIFYPIGICVLIYRIWKKNELKKAEESRRAEAAKRKADSDARYAAAIERERKEREYREQHCDYIAFKLVGVSFNNDDGLCRNRQTILREINRNEDEVEISYFSYDVYDYEGEKAVGVYYNGEQIGNIAREDLEQFLPRADRFYRFVDYEIIEGSSKLGIWVGVCFKKS